MASPLFEINNTTRITELFTTRKIKSESECSETELTGIAKGFMASTGGNNYSIRIVDGRGKRKADNVAAGV